MPIIHRWDSQKSHVPVSPPLLPFSASVFPFSSLIGMQRIVREVLGFQSTTCAVSCRARLCCIPSQQRVASSCGELLDLWLRSNTATNEKKDVETSKHTKAMNRYYF